MEVRPIQRNAKFRFRVHFENLTEDELHKLLQAIRPTAAARQKIGLGKPLGLGTVRVDLADQVHIYSRERYGREGLKSDSGFVTTRPRKKYGFTPPAIRHLVETPFRGVSYPRVQYANGEDRKDWMKHESKLFEWFVANDSGSGGGNNPPKNQAAKKRLNVLTGTVEALAILPYTKPQGGG